MDRRTILIFILAFAILVPSVAFGKICPRCGRNHLPDDPAPKVAPKQDPPKEEPKEEPKVEEEEEPIETLSVTRKRFYASSIEIADEADKILDRLEERYGQPKTCTPFPMGSRRIASTAAANPFGKPSIAVTRTESSGTWTSSTAAISMTPVC